jgi:hypothetical protein
MISKAGEVQEGRTQNYKIHQRKDEILIALLLTDEGDGDMYIAADRQVKLSTNDFDYSSASCGTDMVVIVNENNNALRPLDLVVYGHPRHPTTKYRLYVIRSEKSDLDRYSVQETWPNEDGTISTITRYEFINPLAIANDPNLVKIVDRLKALGSYFVPPLYDKDIDGTSWWTILGKLIELAVEILV